MSTTTATLPAHVQSSLHERDITFRQIIWRLIPFLTLTPGPDRAAIDSAIARVVDRGWFILGPELEQFENAFAGATGARHAIGVGNGTDALAIALRAAGIGRDDEVITSPLSAAYTALAIMMVGARPVFADSSGG